MSPVRLAHISIHQVIRLVLFAIAAIFFIFYVQYQARNLLSGPVIELTSDIQAVQHDRSVALEGRASNIISLSLNGMQIYTDEQGNFKHPLILENGYTIMTLTAKDRFGRTATITRHFVYQPVTS